MEAQIRPSDGVVKDSEDAPGVPRNSHVKLACGNELWERCIFLPGAS